jgi:hypothetical protein
MTTKADINKRIYKGLTGKEGAQLVLQDNWEVDHDREGLLSKKDLSALKSSIRSMKEIEEYNKYVGIYRLVDYTIRDAHIIALEAEKMLLMACREIDEYLLEDKKEKDPLVEGSKLWKALQEAHYSISERVKNFLAIQAVIEAVSKVVGVDFTEDMEDWYRELNIHIILYNSLSSKNLGVFKVPPLNMRRLRPPVRSIRYYQERIALALGKDWYKDSQAQEVENGQKA